MAPVALGQRAGVKPFIQLLRMVGIQLPVKHHLVIGTAGASKAVRQFPIPDKLLVQVGLGFQLPDSHTAGHWTLFFDLLQPLCDARLPAHRPSGADQPVAHITAKECRIQHSGPILKIPDQDTALTDQIPFFHSVFPPLPLYS